MHMDMGDNEKREICKTMGRITMLSKYLLNEKNFSPIKFVGSDFDYNLLDLYVTEESFEKIIEAEDLDIRRVKVKETDGAIWKSIAYMDFNIYCILDKE